MEALQPALGIDEGARGFSERGDRQHDVGVVRRAVLERRQGDDELCLLHGVQRCLRVVAIELDFGVQQDVGLAGGSEHRRGIDLAGRPGDISAHAVGRFAEEPDFRPEAIGQRLRDCVQLRRLRMLLREIAEQDRDVLSRLEAFADGPLHDCGQRRRQFCRRHDHFVGDVHQQVVVRGMQDIDLEAALGRLAQAIRNQRMVLAQE